MASRGEAWEHEAKRNPYNKKHGFAASFRSIIVRFGMTNRFVKDCRVASLLAMTESVGLIENAERKTESSESVKRF
jgi:hypothetical protein